MQASESMKYPNLQIKHFPLSSQELQLGGQTIATLHRLLEHEVQEEGQSSHLPELNKYPVSHDKDSFSLHRFEYFVQQKPFINV